MSNRLRASWFALVVLALGSLAATTAQGEELKSAAPCCSTPHGKRPGDQIWVISTRHLGCNPVTESLPRYGVKYFAKQQWHASSAETFLAFDDPARPTIVFIHGNRYSAGEAIGSGWEAYHALVRCVSPEQPIRFVIWSWPSEKDGGPIRDARVKASRTLVESYYLARILNRIDPAVSTGIVGYSFGSKVALGAVHLTAGGQLSGRVVPDLRTKEVAMFRVAMLAAGVENNGLMPGARYQLAMSRTDRLLNLYNPADPVLKRYRVVSKYEKPTAMGYSGVVGEGSLGPAAARIVECNVSGIIGKTHNEDPYFASERLMSQVRATVIGLPSVATAPSLAKK